MADDESKNKPKKTVNTGRIRRERKAAILAAAEKAFALNGFKGTSTSSIAKAAGLGKAQLHYYFPSKSDLYQELLLSIMEQWNCTLENITAEDDPAEVLREYICAKLRLSWDRPELSKIFAGEVLRGAPVLQEYCFEQQRAWLAHKSDVFKCWIDAGKMDPIDPVQLIFMIWSVTQHYADYQAQVLGLMNQKALSEEHFVCVSEQVVQIIFKGCGIDASSYSKQKT
ncbi:TetR/AcrR family transcriptional regulator [Motiliproteus sp. MSK22-1]|uniref:TetR/AcrR family transcriptional regulator n=1 Tax=Motiliproteus sp. MSK22-1 TaxID=1897630 RepID=UPI000976D5F3|nr:TetR/AcrR family transcriptional regulator [Motiliproteus sp. MSK22-1]OMH28455.1 hypothetical protein BGP75_21405 [Motiliproteus sp. MSK22-1]